MWHSGQTDDSENNLKSIYEFWEKINSDPKKGVKAYPFLANYFDFEKARFNENDFCTDCENFYSEDKSDNKANWDE